MPKTKETLSYFRRYSKFYLGELEDGDENLCWRVEAKDSISMPGILELIAEEYYSNEYTDDISNGLAGGLTVTEIQGSDIEEPGFIEGPNVTKPKTVKAKVSNDIVKAFSSMVHYRKSFPEQAFGPAFSHFLQQVYIVGSQDAISGFAHTYAEIKVNSIYKKFFVKTSNFLPCCKVYQVPRGNALVYFLPSVVGCSILPSHISVFYAWTNDSYPHVCRVFGIFLQNVGLKHGVLV